MSKKARVYVHGFLIFTLAIQISASSSAATSKIRPFSDYFDKVLEIRIETAGLAVNYIWQFLVDGQARILALDAKGCQLLVFEEDGRFLRRMGREGQGPGEFSLPFAMCLDPRGLIHVADSRMRRINAFSEDGTFIGSFVFSVNHSQALMFRVDSAGNRFLAALTTPTESKKRADWLVNTMIGASTVDHFTRISQMADGFFAWTRLLRSISGTI